MSGASLLVALLSFATMVGCNVWLKSMLRLFAPLLGLCVGMAAGFLLDLVPAQELQQWREMPLLRLPQLPVFGWAFEPLGVLPYVVTGFALSLTSMGTQTIVQRVSDADWVRPNLRALARGVRAEGVAHLFAGLLNALPMSSSGGAVSLAAASGCTSRYLGYWTAGFLFLAALLPHITGAWLLLPAPVTGALLLYLSAFATLSGLQLIASRMLDNRRVLAARGRPLTRAANRWATPSARTPRASARRSGRTQSALDVRGAIVWVPIDVRASAKPVTT